MTSSFCYGNKLPYSDIIFKGTLSKGNRKFGLSQYYLVIFTHFGVFLIFSLRYVS